MNYRRRFSIGVVGSLAVHAALAVFLLWLLSQTPPPSSLVHDEPIIFTFKSLETDTTPKRLADAVAPTTEPVGPTDLIAEQNSKAQDPSDVVGTRLAPYFEKRAEIDQVGQPGPKKPPEPVVEKTKPLREDKKAPPPKKAKKEPAKKKQPPLAPSRKPDVTAPSKEASPGADHSENEGGGEASGRMQMAKAENGSAAPDAPTGDTRGRLEGGVLNKGFMGFEAMKDEVAPYLKEIQVRVERNWRVALQTRYSGTTPTRAIVDCAIGPDGRVQFVEIVEPGDSTTYAPLCKEAIEKAGPFPPFPFKVPDMYRSKDLEIRWSFSFLMSE